MTAELRGAKVTVMGLGRFGGGLGVTRYLLRHGARVTLTDLEDEASLAEPLQAVRAADSDGELVLRLGGHDERDFADADRVIANPAAPKPWDNPYLKAATRAGVPVTTEIAMAIDLLPDPSRVVAVTGTAGKSTTASMTAEALTATGSPVLLGGNIGGSLLDHAESITRKHYIVLELSSAMLHWLRVRERRWAPGVAVITNCRPNHLDWHGSLEAYTDCKRSLLEHQSFGDAAVLGGEAREWATPPGVQKQTLDDEDALEGLSAPGLHNAMNGAAALYAASFVAGDALDLNAAARAVAAFPGLPHRLHLCAEARSVRFYDDSKSSTPDTTRIALRALAESGADLGRVHLLCGGYDKGIELRPLAKCARELASTHAIGQTASAIARLASEEQGAVEVHPSLEEAFAEAMRRTQEGDVVLLSPGCASWDQFRDYRERGERFAALATAWAEQTAVTP
ncbi:MAG: UDP-N-acetylmuramoyl-L-alanine--D-glutamate ligase [Planctomycetota bacterium]